jgi:hypothetical protein
MFPTMSITAKSTINAVKISLILKLMITNYFYAKVE